MDVNSPESQEVLVRNRKPVRSLVGDAISGAKFAPFWLWLVPIYPLPPAGVGLVRSLLALLWYSLSPLFCEQAWQCLRSGLLQHSSLALSLSFYPLSLSLAIQQFRLLSHVSSLRLPSGHSGPVLTLSNVACSSMFSPLLLVPDVSVWGTSLLGVAIRHVICGFYLFIYFSSWLCCPLRFQNSPQTHQ